VHVVARSPESVGRARDGGATSIVAAIADLPAVEGAVVASTTGSHADVARELLATITGPVFVEKPLTDDAAAAAGLAEQHGDRLFVMDKWRYHPAVAELARIARSGELGAVTALTSRRVTDVDRHPDVDTVWTHAPHDLAVALEILGEIPEPVHAVAEHSGGRRVGLVATLGGPPHVTFEVSCVAPAHRRELRLVCEDGVARIDGGWAEEVEIARRGEPTERRATPGELPLLAELRAFVDHVRGGPPPRSSAAEGALVVERIAQLGALAESNEPARA
jgi:predicted dehydrogenase